MDKFEYGRLFHSENLYNTDSWVINHTELYSKGYKHLYQLYDVLNYLGGQGWEMLFKDGDEYVFKRKLKEEI